MSFYSLTPYEQAIVYEIFHSAGVMRDELVANPSENRQNWDKIAPAIVKYLKTRALDIRPVNEFAKTIDSTMDYPVTFPLINAKTGEAPQNPIIGMPTSTEVFTALIKFCINNKLYWDDCDKNYTKFEVEAFYDTEFGKLVKQYYGFTSQPEPGTVTNIGVPGTSTTQAPRQRQANQSNPNGPQKDYKSLGPLASSCRGIISSAQPEQLNNVYKIVGIPKVQNIKSEVNLYIKPVTVGNYGANGANSLGINRVFLGTAKGYGYCPCLFRQEADAARFKERFETTYSYAGSNIDSLKIVRAPKVRKAFLIHTECGDCYISGSKINEALEKELDDQLEEDIITEDGLKEASWGYSKDIFSDMMRD